MLTYYRNYNPVKWSETLDKFVKNAAKYPLVRIDYVPITQSELEKIELLESRRVQRLMFTMLCIAKFYDLKNPQNKHWVNQDDKVVFALASTPMSKHDQNIVLHELFKAGYIKFSQKVDNLNSQVQIIDNDSPVVLKINDFRKLGYEYMLYKGANYVRCRNCGQLVKQNKNGTRQFCDDCAGYVPKEMKTLICVDCGQLFVTSAKNTKSTRCETCQKEYERARDAERKRQKRACPPTN